MEMVLAVELYRVKNECYAMARCHTLDRNYSMCGSRGQRIPFWMVFDSNFPVAPEMGWMPVVSGSILLVVLVFEQQRWNLRRVVLLLLLLWYQPRKQRFHCDALPDLPCIVQVGLGIAWNRREARSLWFLGVVVRSTRCRLRLHSRVARSPSSFIWTK